MTTTPASRPGTTGHGRTVAALLAASDAWLHRRSELVRFHDDATVSRRITVELTVGGEMPRLAGGGRLVPVTVLAKRPLAGFAVTDEDGAMLPVLTAGENLAVVRDALVAMAEALLGSALPAAVAADLAGAVTAPRRDGAALARLWGAASHRDVRTRLRAAGDGVFAALVHAFAGGFLVLVPLESAPGTRRVLTVAADEPVAIPAARGSAGWGRRLGWLATPLVFRLGGVLAGRSAHFEVAVPAGVDVEHARARRRGRDAEVLATSGDARTSTCTWAGCDLSTRSRCTWRSARNRSAGSRGRRGRPPASPPRSRCRGGGCRRWPA